MRSRPDKRISLDKLNKLIAHQNDYMPNHELNFEGGDEIIYDDAAEDMKYFYSNLGVRLGYTREYKGNRETSFIEYDYRKNVEKARSRQNSFIDKENQFNKANTPLKASRSSNKMLRKSAKMLTPKKRGSTMNLSNASYTPSVSPMKQDFSEIEQRFKERKIHRLQK